MMQKNWVNLAVIYSAFSQYTKVKINWFIHYIINFWSLLPPLKANWDSSRVATCYGCYKLDLSLTCSMLKLKQHLNWAVVIARQQKDSVAVVLHIRN